MLKDKRTRTWQKIYEWHLERGFEWVNNVGSLGNQGISVPNMGNYCWWFRNPANHLGCNKKKLKIVGQTTNQQLVSESTPDFWTSHQQCPTGAFSTYQVQWKSKQRFLKLSLFCFESRTDFTYPIVINGTVFLNLHLRTISTSTTHVGKYTRIHGMVWVLNQPYF